MRIFYWNNKPRPFECRYCGETDETKRKPRYQQCYACHYKRGEGAEIAERGLKRLPNGSGHCPVKRRISSTKYIHKRRARTVLATELDDFVYEEAVSLAVKRSVLTGFQWSVDHIIPLHHKDVCGLHVAANFQVVPSIWNSWKGNRNTDTFLGTNGRTEANQT